MIRFIAFIVFMLFYSISSVSAEKKEAISGDFLGIPPWNFTEGEITRGITFESTQALMEEAKLDHKGTLLPPIRFFKRLAKGETDFGIIYRTPDSDKISTVLLPIFDDLRSVVLPKKGIKIDKWKDLEQKKIGIVRGLASFYDKRFSTSKTINFYEYNKDIQGMEMLKRGRVDAVVITRESSYFIMKQKGWAPQDFGSPFLISSQKGYLVFSKRSKKPHLQNRLKAAAESLKKKGVFEKILDKYIGF